MPKSKQEYRKEIWTNDSYSRTKIPLGSCSHGLGHSTSLNGDQRYTICSVIVERYSKTPILLPCHKDDIAMDFLWGRVISHTALFKNIISDRDPKFTYALWTNIHILFRTKLSFSTAYHSQTDGLGETMIQALEDMIRRFCAYGLEFKDSDGFTHYWCTLIPSV
ncbi:hypothetical protein O181_044909 [Austropuccinia psidii MF-1]|uniref:Integrase catalytic domain-containing protein n=1 Tax=Austropuccinia psidii MF-1 TaxID=1389203 RepID=A0A9Q3HJV3_9BASI|nr:hypothetical protein [Austropuccinia psidii MF-1]